ncbi:MFS transporter [Chloroflexota bacterium]
MDSQVITPSPLTDKPKIFYGYIVVAACFAIMVIMHGIFNTFGIFFTSLESAFNVNRAVISGANSTAFLTMGVSSIIVGILSDKFGPRKVLTICAVLFGSGLLLLSQAKTIWQLYLFITLVGIGLSAPDIIPLSTVVRWFVKKRGAMSGIMKVGTGTGMMIMPIVASMLIATIDWRNAYLVLGTLVLVTVIPLAQLLRRDPREMGLLPDGEQQQPNTKIPPPVEEGLSLREALQTRQLWLVCGYYFTITFCGISILTHIAPHAMDMDITRTVAAGIVSLIGGTSIAGRLVMGFAGDRIGQKRGVVICFIILIIALSLLQVARQPWMLFLFAAIYGFNHGGFFALISPLIAGLFGTRSQGTLLGSVIFCGTVGGSTGMVLAGHIFDLTGSYQIAFIILLVLAVLGLTAVSFIKPIEKGKRIDPRN